MGIEKTRHEHFYGNLPSYVNHLRTWGEVGTVKLRTTTDSKLKDLSGAVCVMIGYANQHSGDTYRMYDPVTRNIYESRDVKWLGRMFWTKPHDAIDDYYYNIAIPEHLNDQILMKTRRRTS
jgi:hypothetical protein